MRRHPDVGRRRHPDAVCPPTGIPTVDNDPRLAENSPPPKELPRMDRRTVALVLFALAAVCFGLVLASALGSDFAVNEPAFLAAGFLASALGLVVERLG